MFKIKIPATSANIGVGYDVMGLAFNLYNEFVFEVADEFELSGFDIEYINEENLCKSAYSYLFKLKGLDIVPVKINLISSSIPIARGLGSSTSLIVAGIFAANEVMKKPYTVDELYSICCNIEGHPDNVGPAIYGGLSCGYKIDDKYKHISYPVNSKLKFLAVVPDQKIATKISRAVLPHEITYPDIINNTSRIVHMPFAFKTGNITLLRELTSDRLHEPYRMPLIFKAYEVKNIALANDSVCTLSGSGSTLLIITKKANLIEKFVGLDCQVFNLELSSGISIEGE